MFLLSIIGFKKWEESLPFFGKKKKNVLKLPPHLKNSWYVNKQNIYLVYNWPIPTPAKEPAKADFDSLAIRGFYGLMDL